MGRQLHGPAPLPRRGRQVGGQPRRRLVRTSTVGAPLCTGRTNLTPAATRKN
jgi:hypothetical protein